MRTSQVLLLLLLTITAAGSGLQAPAAQQERITTEVSPDKAALIKKIAAMGSTLGAELVWRNNSEMPLTAILRAPSNMAPDLDDALIIVTPDGKHSVMPDGWDELARVTGQHLLRRPDVQVVIVITPAFLKCEPAESDRLFRSLLDSIMRSIGLSPEKDIFSLDIKNSSYLGTTTASSLTDRISIAVLGLPLVEAQRRIASDDALPSGSPYAPEMIDEQESELYAKAEQAGSSTAYRRYIRRFPEGKHVAEARQHVEDLADVDSEILALKSDDAVVQGRAAEKLKQIGGKAVDH